MRVNPAVGTSLEDERVSDRLGELSEAVRSVSKDKTFFGECKNG
jgi:hypothetical protein